MTDYIVTLRGIGEPLSSNLLTGLVRHFPDEWEHIEVAHPAEYGFVNGSRNPFADSYEDTKADGMRRTLVAVEQLVDADPHCRIVLAGYSGGANIAGDFATEYSARFPQLRYVILVADPLAPGTPKLYGIAGRRPVRGVKTAWISRADDVICCCPDSSPLRVVARLTRRMCLGDRSVWARDVFAQLADPKVRAEIERELGPWWQPSAWGRYEAAAAEARRYLGGGPKSPSTHTQYASAFPKAAATALASLN